jgi:hypothetical protein
MASTSVVFDILARDQASAKFDHLGNRVDDSSSKMSKFNSVMKSAGKAAAYGLGAGLVIAAGAAVKFTQAAAEDAQAAELLSGALKRNADATDEQVGKVEKWITAIGRAKGVADDDLRPALTRLVTATHDVQKAQVLAQVAMDVSAGSGKSLESVSTALMKAQNGQVSALSRLGINTKLTAEDQQAFARAAVEASKGTITMEQALKTAASQTITMDQAVTRMSETFGGAASAKAETFQGKMDRLKLMMSETGEAIGYKLMPVAVSLLDWITGTAIPAVEKFTAQWQSHRGEAGQVRAVLEKVRDVLGGVTKFLWDNKSAVAAVVGVYAAWKTAVIAANVVAAVQLTILKAHTVGTIQNTVVTAAASAASKTWAAAQWLLNAALTANPIGLVVVGVGLLVGGFILAYKKSETFRDGVNNLWGMLKKFISFTPLGALIANFDTVKAAVSDVIGMVQSLIGWLGKIRMPDINFPDKPDWLPRMGAGGNDTGIDSPGAALMERIVKGISKGKVKLDTAMEKVKGYISKHMENLSTLLDKRQGILESFGGMTSSIFSTDLSSGEGEAPATVQRMLDAGAQKRANAEALSAAVKSLIGKGLSTDLIQQLMGAGEAGQEQIKLLASGTNEQIAQPNADNLATQQALQEAGLAASAALGVEAAIAQEQANIALAQGIKDRLKELLDEQDKNTVVELHLDGHKILWSLKKIKRQNGGHLGLGDRDND